MILKSKREDPKSWGPRAAVDLHRKALGLKVEGLGLRV